MADARQGAAADVAIDAALVRRLLAEQFPQWAALPITPAVPQGWDNRIFWLGATMSVRLPSAAGYAQQVAKEHRWLPFLAPHLPLPIPAPLAMGVPTAAYLWPWSVYRWIDGVTAEPARIGDLVEFATDLGRFLSALQQIDSTGGPPAGAHCWPSTITRRRAGFRRMLPLLSPGSCGPRAAPAQFALPASACLHMSPRYPEHCASACSCAVVSWCVEEDYNAVREMRCKSDRGCLKRLSGNTAQERILRGVGWNRQ
jgi:hypothetical protein